MIKILDHTKSLTQLVNDNSNGLGKIDPLECLVTEELNGIYEAQIVILQTDKHFKDIALNGLLEINAGEVIGNQIFRIYFISKPIDCKILIKCQHISYDLSKVAVQPFIATGAVNTKNKLLQNIMGTYPFDMMTDINNSTTYFELDIPRSFRECLGGWEGSVLDKFRCEYEWDNLLVKMLAHRGSDNGVRIAYGKNLTDFQQEENIQNVFTSVLGYAVVNEQTYVGDIYHKIVSNLPKVKIVDFSNDFGDTPPTTAQLTQKAQEYATNNSIEVPDVSINISFVPLYQTEEYKNIAPLERVALGDTVHVFFEKLNVEATSRVVKTVWNAILNKYESVELGNTKANLTTLLDDAVQEAKENITIDAGFIETEMNDMSQLIINGLGLHRTLVPLSTGGHRMYLHNKPTLAESDTQYVIAAEGFMISRDYGQTWNSGWDADGNAVVNSLATITLRALEIYGSYLCFGDYPNGKYIEASTYSNSSSVQQGVSFDGTGTIRMQPQEAFYVNNCTSDGSKYFNRIMMNKQGSYSQNYTGLYNYDDTQNYITANFFQLDAHYTSGTNVYNRTVWHNYATHTGTSVSANMLMMEARTNANNLYIRNRKVSSSNYANYIQLNATQTRNYINIYNYQYNADYISNYLEMNDQSGNRRLAIGQRLLSDTWDVNSLSFIYNSGTTPLSRVALSNGAYVSGTSMSPLNYFDLYVEGDDTHVYFRNRDPQGNDRNIILMDRTSNNSTIQIVNYDNSDNVANRIKMTGGTTKNIEIYSVNDIRINSAGAVRLTSGSSQDITLSAADDIYMTWNNKLRMQGYQIGFGTVNGVNVLTWA